MTLNDADELLFLMLFVWIGYSLAQIARRLKKPLLNVQQEYHMPADTTLTIERTISEARP